MKRFLTLLMLALPLVLGGCRRAAPSTMITAPSAAPAAPLADATAGPAGWKRFAPAEGDFSVAMPTEPIKQTQKVATPAGEVPIVLFVVQQGAVAYMAAFNEYPPGVAIGDPETVLNGVSAGAALNVKGKLIDQNHSGDPSWPRVSHRGSRRNSESHPGLPGRAAPVPSCGHWESG
jgi:hypothetical protein